MLALTVVHFACTALHMPMACLSTHADATATAAAAAVDFPDKFDSAGSGPDGDASKFKFSYTMGDTNSVGNVTYDRATETWFFKAKS
jgi:hypothetical protein